MTKQHDDDVEYERLLAEERLILQATELIAEAMNRRGITRKELADGLGVTPGEITQRLSGRRNLTLRSLAAMLHFLNADPALEAEFVDDAERMAPVLLVLPGGAASLPNVPWEPERSIRYASDWHGNERRSEFAIAG